MVQGQSIVNTDFMFSSNGSVGKLASGGTLDGALRSTESLGHAQTGHFPQNVVSGNLKLPQNRVMHSIGIFATISPGVATHASASLLSQLSASFRSLSFCRFNERVLYVTLLKTEGFYNYQLLARLSHEYLIALYDKVYAPEDQNMTHPRGVNDSMVSLISKKGQIGDLDDSQRHLLSLRDLRLAVKLANLIREQEERVYLAEKH
jgi:hypothetical protein